MMLRALIALLAVTSAKGADTACIAESARAVDDILDATVYIFASIYRCDPKLGDKARCVLDVSAAIEAVNRMSLIIVEAVAKCGEIKTDRPECGYSIGELTRSVALLTSASAGIVAKCPNEYNHGTPLVTVSGALDAASTAGGGSNTATNVAAANGAGFNPTFGQCIINVKDSVKSLFKAVKRTMVLKESCDAGDEHECDFNAVKLLDAFIGMSEFISGAVGKCSLTPKNRANGQCAQQASKLTHATGAVVNAGGMISHFCAPTPVERLYLDSLDQKKTAAAPATSGLTMGLTALLPITAVVAFVAGKRLAKVRSAQPLPDEEMLVQSE